MKYIRIKYKDGDVAAYNSDGILCEHVWVHTRDGVELRIGEIQPLEDLEFYGVPFETIKEEEYRRAKTDELEAEIAEWYAWQTARYQDALNNLYEFQNK